MRPQGDIVGDNDPEKVFWQCLWECGASWRWDTVSEAWTNVGKDVHSDATKVWKRISKHNLDAGRIVTLVYAANTYVEARRRQLGHGAAHQGEIDKDARNRIRDLGAQCEKLERSIRQALLDPAMRRWLMVTIVPPRVFQIADCTDWRDSSRWATNSYDLAYELLDQLQQAAGAMRKDFPLEMSQASIFSRMKEDALKEMVQAVAPSGSNVPWTDVAEIVNLLVSVPLPPLGIEIPYVAAKDLHAEYKRLQSREEGVERSYVE
jgi:hypothetical protein